MKKGIVFFAGLLLAACQSAPPSSQPPVPPLSAPQAQPQPSPATPAPEKLATAGPLTSANVEKYLDGLERGLRVLFKGQNVRIARRGESLLITLPNADVFAGDDISPSGAGLIGLVARALRFYDHTVGQVNGYTDTYGPAARNVAVSQAKAKLVADALAQYGVAAGRIAAHGFGSADLKIVTADQVSEPRNLRIEIDILPKPE